MTRHWWRQVRRSIGEARTSFGCTLLLGAFALPLTGCGGTGTCTVYCTFKSSGNLSTHGPYDDYTSEECDEQANQSESPGITTCEGEFEAY